jgi:hypothetical protein
MLIDMDIARLLVALADVVVIDRNAPGVHNFIRQRERLRERIKNDEELFHD